MHSSQKYLDMPTCIKPALPPHLIYNHVPQKLQSTVFHIYPLNFSTLIHPLLSPHNKMEIKRPRRILAVSPPDSGLLDLLKSKIPFSPTIHTPPNINFNT